MISIGKSLKRLLFATLGAALVMIAAGCGGISATKAVSPLDFFLPGAGGLLRGGLLQADPPCTNAPAVLTTDVTELASAK